VTPQPAAASAYDAGQFDDNFPAGIEHHYWFRARNIVLDRALRRAERRGLIPRAASILEVGCGTGVVVGGLRERGHDIRGVELGRPPRALVPDRMRTGIRAQDLAPEVRAGIDALMFLDVIEHVPNDVSFLAETLAGFPRCRAVFVTVPARPELWSNHDRHYGHYRRYTRTSLGRTFAAAGLEINQTRYVFRSLYGAAALMKLVGREREPVLAAPGQPVLHNLATAILATEDRVLAGLPLPGLSLLGLGLRRGR
jgi:2-polyprenyl-3-methyl-5-hydroxy-6-metoxy-1,4-benzoquinol methylase